MAKTVVEATLEVPGVKEQPAPDTKPAPETAQGTTPAPETAKPAPDTAPTPAPEPTPTPKPANAPVYTAGEFAASNGIFECSTDIVVAALAFAGVSECTIDDAKRIVKEFAEKEV